MIASCAGDAVFRAMARIPMTSHPRGTVANSVAARSSFCEILRYSSRAWSSPVCQFSRRSCARRVRWPTIFSTSSMGHFEAGAGPNIVAFYVLESDGDRYGEPEDQEKRLGPAAHDKDGEGESQFDGCDHGEEASAERHGFHLLRFQEAAEQLARSFGSYFVGVEV